jgi:LPS-assembly protein
MSRKSTNTNGTTSEWRTTLSALALVCACLALPQPATAQQGFLTAGDARMRIISDGVDYDYNDHQFAVRGNVQIYYKRATIEADRVVYDQNTKRLRAEGARLTEANGKVMVGQVIDLTDDYRDGFVDSLGVETVAPRRAARQPQRRRSPLRQ